MLQFRQKKAKMEQNGQKKYFWIGTLFLYLAMVILTVLPLFVTQYLPFLYIKIRYYINAALIFFIIASFFYLLSKNTYKRQIISIICAFVYFCVFINLFSD